jgi:hypothetical protein
MTLKTQASLMAFAIASALLAGCAAGGIDNVFTTGAIGNQSQNPKTAETKVDPACVSLAAQIDGLRRDGIAEKIEKASLKKYKLTQGDLAKADQLIKANADFQMRCASFTPKAKAA